MHESRILESKGTVKYQSLAQRRECGRAAGLRFRSSSRAASQARGSEVIVFTYAGVRQGTIRSRKMFGRRNSEMRGQNDEKAE